MHRVRWLMIIIVSTAITGWYFLFYKTYSRQQLPASADMVLAIDVKKNTNNILLWYLQHPSKWGMVFSKNKGMQGLVKNALNIQDYLYFFHSAGQPATNIYCLLSVKEETAFKQLLTNLDFKEQGNSTGGKVYFSEKTGIGIIKKNKQVLVGNIDLKDLPMLHSVAAEVFIQQQFMANDLLKKITAPANDFTFYIKKAIILKEDALLNGHLQNGQLVIEGNIKPAAGFELTEAPFEVPDSSLLTFAFTQPAPKTYALLTDSFKTKLSRIVNFSIDSLFSTTHKQYLLDMASVKSRTDSALSYSFDDNFNKVEKLVVNQVQEPSFNVTVAGGEPQKLYNYWKQHRLIEENSSGNLFTPFPFVKTYAYVTTDSLLLTSNNYQAAKNTRQVTCIGNLCIRTDLLPGNAAALLPYFMVPVIQKIRFVNIIAIKENNGVQLKVTVLTNSPTLPFLSGIQ